MNALVVRVRYKKMILDSLLDALLDSVKAAPFLFFAFFLIETFEKKAGHHIDKILERLGKAETLLGALVGLIPQCGFSAAVCNLYAAGLVSVGSVLAVFLSTSDEAVIIMLSQPGSAKHILPLLLTKLIIGVLAGYIINLFFRNSERKKDFDEVCVNCKCQQQEGILIPTIIHTAQMFAWLFVITAILNIVIGTVGVDKFSTLIGGNTILQPFITALIGLIPNCASSVLMTQLYLSGGLSFASTIAGLCSSAGVGLIVLFRIDRDKVEFLKIVLALYVISTLAGLIIGVVMPGA